MLLDDIADILTTGAVVTTGTDLFKTYMPSTPDELVVLFQTPGGTPVRGMSGAAARPLVEIPHVQAVIRSTTPANAEYLARRVHDTLNGVGPRTQNGVLYHSIFALQDPFFLDLDEAGRTEYVVNFEIMRAPVSSS